MATKDLRLALGYYPIMQSNLCSDTARGTANAFKKRKKSQQTPIKIRHKNKRYMKLRREQRENKCIKRQSV